MAPYHMSAKQVFLWLMITSTILSLTWTFLQAVDVSRLLHEEKSHSLTPTLESTCKDERARTYLRDGATEDAEPSKIDILPSARYPPVRQDSLVALCVVQKDAEYYIDEWVQYQLALGVSDIFLYDNSDDFDLQGWAQRMEAGAPRIHVKHYPGKGIQYPAYRDCVRALRGNEKQFKWAGFIDTDEFLVLKKHYTISELLEEHCPDDCGTLTINWIVFGHNNQTAYAPLPLTKRFTFRQVAHSKKSESYVKSFVRLSAFLDVPDDPHFFNTTGLRYDTSGPSKARGSRHFTGPFDVAALHHMRYKSCKEMRAKCARGRAASPRGAHYCSLPCVLENDTDSLVFDDSAWRFLKERVPAFQAYDTIGTLYGY